MSKRCAKCEKVVYPTEELKCLDKVWHKACFRCWECGMALNMKNYKGYGKKPYCNAHYPTTKHTSVVETPEMARLARNTKMQSQIQYHEQFEKTKGKFTVVADDPETLRIRQNTQNISLIKYHEDFEKNIKGTKIQVTDDPETKRLKAASAIISQVQYKGLKQQSQEMEGRRAQIPYDQESAAPKREPKNDYDPARVGGVRMAPQEAKPSPMSNKNQGHSVTYSAQGRVEQPQVKRVGSIHDYDPLNEKHGSLNTGYTPSSTTRQSAQWEETTPAPQSQNHAPPQAHVPLPQTTYTKPAEPQPPSPEPARPEPSYHPPGVEENYREPKEEHYPPPQHNMPPQNMPPQHGLPPQHDMPPQHGMPPPQHGMPPPQHGMPPPQHGMPPQQHKPQHEPNMAPHHNMAPPPQPQPVQQPIAPVQPPPPQPEPVAQPPAPAPASSGPIYQAMYDYDAQDDDEIGFQENDLVIDCQPIDEGWMFGTIKRTGQRGMLPANYVERVQ